MKTSTNIEWVEFQLRAGATESEFLVVSNAFQEEFLNLQPGYLERTLVRLNDHGRYADLVRWSEAADMHAAKAATKAFPICNAYFGLLEVPNAPSLGLAVAHYDSVDSQGDVAPVAAVGGLEFSFFQPKPGVTDDMLKRAAEQMANGLYRGQPGYFSHAVAKTETGVYADVVLASSAKRAAELCAMWGTGPYAKPCLPYLELIRPESMQIGFFETLK